MAFEPINIFSRRVDPRGVVEVLRRSGFKLQTQGPDDDWQEIVLTVRPGNLLRRPRLMTFGHNSEAYDGKEWPRQVMGMQGYFSRFPDIPLKREILRMIGALQFVLAVPQHDLDIDADDERLALVYAVCQHLDGVIFTPSSLRDAQGRILIRADGEFDPEAVLPQLPQSQGDSNESDETDDEPVPPTPERVARRALAQTAVAARASLEFDAPQLDDPESQRERLLKWIESLEIGDELEPDEWKVLQRPMGRLERQDHIDAMWRVEGLAVLAWALRCHELPPDDELIVPAELYRSMCLFDAEAGRELLRSPELRAAEELEAMRIHLLMLHWRLRDYSIRPQAMDFVAFSQSCWLGSFDISGFRIVDNDLAIRGTAIHETDEETRSMAGSLANERHLAINWLRGDSAIYSETDTST